jgi:hypothetical protein
MKSYRWIKINEHAPFAPRDGAGALAFDDKMWLLGGWNPKDKVNFPSICNNEVWSSRDGAAWVLEKPNTFLSKDFASGTDWAGRHTAGYVVFKDRMWIVGGDCNQGCYQNDVWNSADGVTWNCVSRNVPWAPRCLHNTLVFHDRIWVIAGQTVPQYAPATEVFYSDVWNSADGENWQKVVDKAPWPPRGAIGGNVVFQDRIWLLGGGTYDTPQTPVRKLYNDVWSSADGANWKQHTNAAPWAKRMYQDVAVFDNKMWVMEGWMPESGNRNDVWYSENGETWHELPDTPWKPRHAASVFVYDNALWMVAGNNMESDVWKLERSD